MTDLINYWQELCASYTNDHQLVHYLCGEIQAAYRAGSRHYHNLDHISDLLAQARQYRDQLEDYDVVCFSIFYHDIVYRSLRKDNEFRSAALAGKRLAEIGLSPYRIERCQQQVRATRQHRIDPAVSDTDLPYFLDFDLSILGADRERYHQYTQQIRKEYRIYPGWMYRKGRRKVLAHFLEREQLFLTNAYFEKFEQRARENLQEELASL